MPYPYEVGQRLVRPSPLASAELPKQVGAAAVANGAGERLDERAATLFHGRLCAAQALAPLYRAVLVRPGIQASRESFQEAFQEVKRLYQTALNGVYQELRGSEAYVNLRALMAGPVAALIAEAWELSDSGSPPGVEPAEIERIVELFGHLGEMWGLESASPGETKAEPTLSSDAREALAELRATCAACTGLLQVWSLRPATQRLYLSDQKPLDLVRHIRITLSECADEIVDRLAPDATQLERPSVYCAVLEIVGGLYRSTLDAQFIELSRRIRGMDAQEKRAYLENIPNHASGILIEHTEELFTVLAPSCYPAFDPSEVLSWSEDEQLEGAQVEGMPEDRVATGSGRATMTGTSSSNPGMRPDMQFDRDG